MAFWDTHTLSNFCQNPSHNPSIKNLNEKKSDSFKNQLHSIAIKKRKEKKISPNNLSERKKKLKIKKNLQGGG